MEQPGNQFINAMQAHALWEAEQERKDDERNLTQEDRVKLRKAVEEHENTLKLWDELLTYYESLIDNDNCDYALDLIKEFEERNVSIFQNEYKGWGARLLELKSQALERKSVISSLLASGD